MRKNVKKSKNHFVDNKKFYEAIVVYRKDKDEAKKRGLEEPRMPEYIGACIYKIAKNLSHHQWFINYSFKEEMIGDGIINCIEYFDNFNPDKFKNPFAYFTQVIYFAFRRRIMKEEKIRYSMYKNAENFMVQNDSSELTQLQLYDNINEFIDKYEKKEDEKKRKAKEKRQSKKEKS